MVGYGTVLRGDDGIGWHAAGLLADYPGLRAIVRQRHQLTPELALEVSEAALVVLIDASYSCPAGTITVTRVPQAGDARTSWSHHLNPASLVALAHELYGRAPEVFLVGVGVASTDPGDRLSPAVAAAMPQVVATVVDLISHPEPAC